MSHIMRHFEVLLGFSYLIFSLFSFLVLLIFVQTSTARPPISSVDEGEGQERLRRDADPDYYFEYDLDRELDFWAGTGRYEYQV